MGNYVTAASPILTAITTEGDITNKAKAVGEQAKNSLIYGTATAATGVATIAAAKLTAKYNPVKDTLVEIVDGTAKTTGKGIAKLFPKLKPALQKMGKDFAKIPGFAKAVGAIMLAGSSLMSIITCQRLYNSGKIDQKYEDIAKLKNKATQTLE